MKPAVEQFVTDPARMTAGAVLDWICSAAAKKPKLKLWTASRILHGAGVPWWLPGYKPVLRRVDRLLAELEAQGRLVRRPLQQTSRNLRDEPAYKLAATTDH